MATIYDRAAADAEACAGAGLDGLVVGKHDDIPFLKPGAIGPETAACLAVVTERVRRAAGLPVGVNVLANGAGDVVCGVLAAGLARGLDRAAALRWAVAAATLSVTRHGAFAGRPRAAELAALLP